MKRSKRPTRERKALDAIDAALGRVPSQHAVPTIEDAAEAIEWRNRRLTALEKEIVRLGGDPNSKRIAF